MNKEVRCLIYTMIAIICASIICLVIIGATDKQKEYKSDITTETTTKEIITTTEETVVEKTSEKTSEETTIEKTTTITETNKPSVDKPTEITEETEIVTIEDSEYISLGVFKLTAYCSCSKCCGQWAGSPTASGAMPKANHTIAVDTSVIPFGTEVIIDGFGTYVAEDTGSAIKGNKIDIFFSDHQSAWNFGVQYAEVLIANK